MGTARIRLTILAVVTLLAASCGFLERRDVVLIGDSIIEWNAGLIEDELSGCCHTDVEGRTGARTDEMIDAAALLAGTMPEIAIINLGTNDALQTVEPEDTRASVTALIATFEGARCVYLVNVNETIAVFPGGHLITADIQNVAREVNGVYEEVAAADPRVEVIDWNTTVAEAREADLEIMADAIHPNTEGVEVLSDLFADAVRSCPG